MSGAPDRPGSAADRVRAAAARLAAVRRRAHADALDELAAAVAYHAFLALLPLLVLATAGVGLVLADEAARRSVTAAVADAAPLLRLALLPGGPLATALDGALAGVAALRGPLGLVGAVGLALTGLRLGATLGAGVAAAFRVPRPRGAAARLRAAGVVPLLAVLGLAGVGLPLPLALGLDTGVVAAVYRLLVPTVGRLRDHLAAAVAVAVGWSALRTLGGAFVAGRLAAAGAVWGALAGVVTVLVLLHLLARLLLLGALASALARERRAAAGADAAGSA